ncbi:ribonuclease M5 [Listeria seeligeri]|uniref:ribonuclease M5 n=1 Tax=Listeria seeligeri TaxID=1640 RepID=UPI001624F858|nr:ribonuclease M5 [Listeria seeligeri]MBC1737640.1 ribonuclease M5 [Listeria seeligeri]
MSEKPVIHEFIVVEGRDDTTAINRSVIADTIETNGSALSQETIERIRHAQELRGVIIFTDPDFPGEKIRKQIDSAVPGCKHAFINRQDALPKVGRGLGVEHASSKNIQEALQHFHTSNERTEKELISKDILIHLGLLGGIGSKERREKLGNTLKIGYTNGKQLQTRLESFAISEAELVAVCQKISQEEENE